MQRHLRIVVLLVGCLFVVGSPVHAALIANVAAGSTNVNDVTTGTIDTTGANFLVCSTAGDLGVAAVIVTDSKSNAWVPLTRTCGGVSPCNQLVYAVNPTVGASHTFTGTRTSAYPSIACAAFSTRHLTTPFDVENGASTASGTTLSTGSVTPSANNELIIAGLAGGNNLGTVSINASLTITNTVTFLSSNHYLVSLAYFEQTTAAAINPQWSWNNEWAEAARIATFKEVAASGPPVGSRMLLGVGR